jgi:hypothetical protein
LLYHAILLFLYPWHQGYEWKGGFFYPSSIGWYAANIALYSYCMIVLYLWVVRGKKWLFYFSMLAAVLFCLYAIFFSWEIEDHITVLYFTLLAIFLSALFLSKRNGAK